LTKVVFRNSSGGAIVKQVDYEYDAYNRLVRRTFDADGAGAGAATNQYWVYDEGINAVLQFDGSSASNLSHRYLWSDNVDELLADEQIAGNNTLWGLADHLGSLRDIADYSESTGVTTIANHRTLNSFGKLVSETNAAVDMLFAFTGKQFDEATGLQHNLFRWYDPVLGQWLSEDPIGFAAGDENVRRYVGNGVVDSVDPTGLVNQAQYGWWHFADAFCDYITPWNGTPGSDMERGVSYVGTGFLVVGTTAAVGAGAVIVSGTGGTIVYGTQATAKVLTAAEMQALQTATYIRRLQYLKWLKEGGKGIPPNTGF
jgi:RHS repeat-associated protein